MGADVWSTAEDWWRWMAGERERGKKLHGCHPDGAATTEPSDGDQCTVVYANCREFILV